MFASKQLSRVDNILLLHGSLLENVDNWIGFLTTVIPPGDILDVGTEGIITSTALLNVYKKQIIMRLLRKDQKPLVSRFIDSQYRKHKSYRLLSYMLTFVKKSELLIEMLAATYGSKKGKWRAVLGLESFKALVRLLMLIISKKITPSATPVHDVDLPSNEVLHILANEPHEKEKHDQYLIDVDSMGSSYRNTVKPPSVESAIPPSELLSTVNARMALSEVLYIIRPLVYASLLYKYRHNKRNWTPWIVGFSMEFISRDLARTALRKLPFRTTLEKEIYNSRDHDMLWWCMRGAMYTNTTRPMVNRVLSVIDRIPVVRMASVLADSFFSYMDDFYFSSSTL